ncbi:hypothetical protein FQN50_009261 [Emmonsiellopsis sp. PD_5]|nr:hypothetical protein FQN50_009261 [Emmonsiellopsis sp. PD_5]
MSATSPAPAPTTTPPQSQPEPPAPAKVQDQDQDQSPKTEQSPIGASGNIEVVLDSQQEAYNKHNASPQAPPSSTSGNIEVVTSSEKQVHLDTDENGKQVYIDHQGGSGNIEVANKPKEWCRFQVEKSTALGLILPMDLQLRILDPRNLSVAFITTEMHWQDVMSVLPPMFSVYPVSASSGAAEGSSGSGVVNFCPRGWQGVTSLKAELELIENNSTTGQGSKRRWLVNRDGWKRHHSMIEIAGPASSHVSEFVWKGSMDILNQLDDSAPQCKGNLKLESVDGKVLLAAWKQRRNGRIMGSIVIFEAARDVIPVEVVVASCISVVMAERATGINFFGGKKKK